MDWVKLATRYYDDAQIEALDDAAEVMFTRGLARAGELEREGFIPDSSLPKLTRRRRYEALVNELVESGLWTRVPGGVQVARWSDWQDSLDELARKRAVDRDRQRRRRERLATVSRDNGQSSRDVTRTEEELDTDLKGGSAKSYDREDDAEPPLRCQKHTKTRTPPACGDCADARKAHNRWEAERAKRLASAPKCRVHRGQLAHNCALCRAEELSPA